MMCMALILVCSVSISTFAVDRMSQVESGTTQSVQKTDNQNGETATTRQKSSEAETKTKQENTKKSDSESKTKENKDSSEEKQSDSKDVNDKGAKENSTQKEEKEKKEKSEKDTSKEEKSTKEETDTTDASEATTKTAEEEKTESAEEKTTEAATEKTTESKNGEEETSEKKAEEETQEADAKRQKIQVAEITGSNKKVQVGETITLETSGYYTSNHKWTSSDTNIATIDDSSNKSTVTVRGVAVGKATITHTYTNRWGNQSETYEVTVTKFEDNYNGDAAIYYLANPAGDPWTNDTGAWAPSTESSKTIAKINTKGATWKDGYVNSEIFHNKNIKSEVASYITSWPDGSKGGTWTVKKNDSATGEYFDFILKSIWDNYKSSVAKELGIDENDVKKENITEITLTPRKISRANGGSHNYHIDCALSIKSTQVFTAKFWVKEPGDSVYIQVDAKNYKTEESVAKTKKATIGFTKTVNDVTYALDGWYPENATGGAYGSKKIEDDRWSNYIPSEDELKDGTVNFYAHYSPKATSIILKKLVTGSMGDKQKEFAFTCTYSSYNATTKETEANTASFNLKDGQSMEIENVCIGSQFTVKETNAKGYTTSGSYNNADISSLVEHGTDNSEKIAVVQIEENGKNITITNNKEAIPDTGIASDVLPFITLFALSIAGIIGFLLYSYKKRFV